VLAFFVSVWEVREPLEKNDGRGGDRLVGYFLRSEQAVDVGRGLGVMGADVQPTQRWAVRVEEVAGPDHYYLLADAAVGHAPRAVAVVADGREWERRRALEKLTERERAILGVG
jgi:hypothetical protein